MPKYVWDAEMVARAAGMKRAGFTAKVIAERLGVTKAAVVARMSRAGAHVRLDGKTGPNKTPRGPMTADIMRKMQRVEEYLEQPEEEN
jgi:predicted transcriptional regulator